MDTVQRLRLMGAGYNQLRWWLFLLLFVLFITGNDGVSRANNAGAMTWFDAIFTLAVAVYVSVVLWLGTSKIFRAKGWPRWYALVLALVPGVCFVLSRETDAWRYPLWFLFIVSLFGTTVASCILSVHEFRKFGLRVDYFMTESKVKAILAEAHFAEREPLPVEVG